MLENLNLNEEQLTGVKEYLNTEISKVTEGLFNKEQLDTEVAKAKEGLIPATDLETLKGDYETKLSTLNEELVKYKPKEKSDAEKLLEQKDAELKQYKIKENLTKNNLPSEFAEFISNVDEKDLSTYIEKLNTIVNDFVVDGSFKGIRHKKSDDNSVTKEQFKNMSYSDRAKLSEEKPELYKKLSS